ncbi:MAG: hypothetical protein E6344_18070 [Clostridium sp.]|nr:hypothetical protein [Clostridium sp.]MDU7085604.1 hypothetical protein [Clostridium sp.]
MDLNVNIEVEVADLKEYKEILKEVKESLEKECNCTCTLNVKMGN